MNDLFTFKPASAIAYDGETYSAPRDYPRLNKQTAAVFAIVRDGQWRTLAQIAAAADAPEASVSARLRDLRKASMAAIPLSANTSAVASINIGLSSPIPPVRLPDPSNRRAINENLADRVCLHCTTHHSRGRTAGRYPDAARTSATLAATPSRNGTARGIARCAASDAAADRHS